MKTKIPSFGKLLKDLFLNCLCFRSLRFHNFEVKLNKASQNLLLNGNNKMEYSCQEKQKKNASFVVLFKDLF